MLSVLVLKPFLLKHINLSIILRKLRWSYYYDGHKLIVCTIVSICQQNQTVFENIAQIQMSRFLI